MAEDWLPHEPPPTPPPNKIKKTILIWSVMVLVFVAIYAMLTSANDARSYDARITQVTNTGYSGWWIVLAAGVGLGLPFALFVWFWGNHVKFNKQLTPGLEALATGRTDAAIAQFAELAHRYRGRPNHSAVALYNQGAALIDKGDSAAAVGVLLGAYRRATAGVPVIRELAAIQLVRGFTLGNDLERAKSWLEVAKRRADDLGDAVYGRALVSAVEGLLLCRAGEVEAALRVYEEAWSYFEARLPIEQMAEVWLLRAYAITATSGPRDSAAAEPFLRLARTRPAKDFDYLVPRWPELATFVETHGLGKPAAQQSA